MKQIDFGHQIEYAICSNSTLLLLEPDERKQLAARSSLFALERGEALYHAGDAVSCAWAVVSGQVKIVKESHSGHRLLIEIIIARETCGGDCYSDEDRFIFSAFAMEPTTALRYPIEYLRKFAASNLAFSRAAAKDLCRRLYHAQHMRSLSIEDVAGRVACALVYLEDKFGNEIPHSRATLAELAGTTVESAIRTTKMLTEKGIIATQRNRITIRSLPWLKDFAHKPGARE
jgi:CRP/FNR family transcriptional regulator